METVEIPAQLKKQDDGYWKASCWAIERSASTVTNARAELRYAVIHQIAQSPVHAYRRAHDGVIFHLYFVDGWRFDKIDAAATSSLSPVPLRSIALRDSKYDDAMLAMESAIRIYETDQGCPQAPHR